MAVSSFLDVMFFWTFGRYGQKNCFRKSRIVVYLKSTFARKFPKTKDEGIPTQKEKVERIFSQKKVEKNMSLCTSNPLSPENSKNNMKGFLHKNQMLKGFSHKTDPDNEMWETIFLSVPWVSDTGRNWTPPYVYIYEGLSISVSERLSTTVLAVPSRAPQDIV